MENHLSYSKGTKAALDYRGYFNDTCGEFDDVGSTDSSSNYEKSKKFGFKKRTDIFAESKWVYFCINLHSDITTLRKYLPTNIKIKFEFERSEDEFILLSHDKTTKFFIDFGETYMSCKRYKPSRTFQNFYNNQLKSGNNPTLPIDRSLIKSYVVNSGSTDLSVYNLIRGSQLPEQIIIGVVCQDAYNGTINKNPFNFQHFDIQEASLVVNGVNEPIEMYKLNVDIGDKVDMFANFLENTGVHTDDREFGITIDDYYGGSFLIVWDRTPDKCNRYHRHVMGGGNIDINIKTRTPLNETVTVIVYATYSSDIIINNEKVHLTTF